MATNPRAYSYRWGEFQGWGLIIFGIFQLVTMTSVFFWPYNHFAVGFFQRYDPDVLAALRQDASNGKSAFISFVFGYSVWTWLLGILILKKRVSLVLFILIHLLRASFWANVYAIIFWIVCITYYIKRRSEFRWP